jgi:methyl-accepting chemotaxis protein
VLVLLTAVGVTVNLQMSRMNANTQHIVNQLRLQSLAREGQAGTYFTALYLYRAIAEPTSEALDCRPWPN